MNDNETGKAQDLAARNKRTALILAGIALVFFIALYVRLGLLGR